MMKTIGVHGGAGFIGQYTVKELLSRGYHVVVFDRYLKEVPEGVDFFLGDIQDPIAMVEFAAHVDGIIALGGTLGTAETIENPTPAVMTNIQGGLNTLEAATQYDIPMVQIAVGNFFEYSTYSISKTTVERFCVMFRKYRGTKVSVVRAMNAWGPGQSVAAPYGNSKVRKFLPSIIARALHNDDVEIYGDGEQVMDYIHNRDLARVLVDTLEYTNENGPIEHVLEAGMSRESTINDVARIVMNEIPESTSKINRIPMRIGETPGSRVIADNTTLNILGDDYAKDFTDLEDGMAEQVEYYRGVFNQ